jgi:signal peptidase I
MNDSKAEDKPGGSSKAGSETKREKEGATKSTRPAAGKGTKGRRGKIEKKGVKADDPGTRWDRTKANFRTIGGAFLLAILIRVVLFEAFEIEGPSMEPTLQNGDRVVVAKFMYGLFLPFTDEALFTWGGPLPGDVVIVKSPHDGIDIVKRVIGVEGDVMEVRDDVIYRNGHPIPQERAGECTPDLMSDRDDDARCEWIDETIGDKTYRTSHNPASPPHSQPPITIPEDHVYILGDHRDRSNDSRFIGPVHENRIKGRALFIYWSSASPNCGNCRPGRLFNAVH